MSSDTQPMMVCIYHPNIRTMLRCGRCERPICIRDAKLTPVGYRCRDCLKGQQAAFYTGTRMDYAIAAAITLPLAAMSALVVPYLSWFAIIAAPLAGGFFAGAVRRAVRRRRSHYLWLVACSAIVLGTALGLIWGAESWLSGGLEGEGVASLVWPAAYLGLATGTIYARLHF